MFLGIAIEHIPGDIRTLATKFANVTNKIKADLQSGIVTDIAALIPGAGQLQTELIAACDVALKACKAVNDFDSPAVSGILQRLGSDLTKLEHESTSQQHHISFYINCFEVIFHDLFGAAAPDNTPPAIPVTAS